MRRRPIIVLSVAILGLLSLVGCRVETDSQGGVWLQCEASDYTAHLDMGGDLYYTPNNNFLYLVGCQGGYLFGGGPPGPGDSYPRRQL